MLNNLKKVLDDKGITIRAFLTLMMVFLECTQIKEKNFKECSEMQNLEKLI